MPPARHSRPCGGGLVSPQGEEAQRAEELMADFPREEPHGATDLLHLLSCPTCRSWAIGRLLGERSPLPDDETHEEASMPECGRGWRNGRRS